MSKIDFQVGVMYKPQVLKNGVVVRELDWKHNIVTNFGLDALASSSSPAFSTGYLRVGTGTAAPGPTDVGLDNEIAGISISGAGGQTVQVAEPPYYVQQQKTATFAEGAVVGNVTEVGISPTSSTSVISRALFLDEGGSPTSITVLADEQLRVIVRTRLYFPDTDVVGTITDEDGVTEYDYIIRPASVNSWRVGNGQPSVYGTVYAGDIGAITGSPSGSSNAISSQTNDLPYTSGTYYADVEVSLSASQGNLSGNAPHRSYRIQRLASVSQTAQNQEFQIQFDPPIPKTNEDALRLVFRFTYSRYVAP